MKKLVLVLLAPLLMATQCNIDDDLIPVVEIAEETLIGRWNLVGFEGLVLYEFTEDKRYTFYASPSEGIEFGTLEALIAAGSTGLDYWYEGELVTIDLNFGNTSTLTPVFKCNNFVVEWVNDDSELHSIIFREGYDFAECSTIN